MCALISLTDTLNMSRIFLLLVLSLPLALQAKNDPWSLTVQWDNDLLTGTDDGYTNGVRAAYSKALDPTGHSYHFLEGFLKSLTGANQNNAFDELRFSDSTVQNMQYGIGLSQLMFTPEATATTLPPAGERPYAGWLGLEFSLQVGSEKSSNTATLSIGTTGKNSYAEDMQKWVHRNISDSPVFQGWDSQVPSELTINLLFDHKTKLGLLEHMQLPVELDGFYEWGALLGNFRTDAYLGALLRAGHNLPSGYVTPRVQLGSFNNTIFGKRDEEAKDFSIYGFAGARGYGVLHDISLDGPLFRDWDQSVESKPLVGELLFGLAARWKWAELSLSHTLRSDEFERQRNRSRYGSVLFKVGTDF